MQNQQVFLEKLIGISLEEAKELTKDIKRKTCKCKGTIESGPKSMVYTCDCSYKEEVCWCMDCFDKEKHKDHHYQIKSSKRVLLKERKCDEMK